MRIIKLSVSQNEIMPLTRTFPMRKILADLDYLRDEFYPELPVFSTGKNNRREIVEALCVWRKELFDEYPEIYINTESTCESTENSDTATSIDDRERQSQHWIYELDDDVKREFM